MSQERAACKARDEKDDQSYFTRLSNLVCKNPRSQEGRIGGFSVSLLLSSGHFDFDSAYLVPQSTLHHLLWYFCFN